MVYKNKLTEKENAYAIINALVARVLLISLIQFVLPWIKIPNKVREEIDPDT